MRQSGRVNRPHWKGVLVAKMTRILVAGCLIAAALVQQVSQAQTSVVPKPAPVLVGEDKQLSAWLRARHDDLRLRAEELETQLAAHQDNCRSVHLTDAGLREQCLRENGALTIEWNDYETQLKSYERQRHLVVLLEQNWSATDGLHSSAKAFLARLPRLGFDAARQFIVISTFAATVATLLENARVMKFPTLGIRSAVVGLIASVVWFQANAIDCNFADEQLKTTCQNFQVFRERLKQINEEIERNYTDDERLQLGR
jgi:hypothetical protein